MRTGGIYAPGTRNTNGVVAVAGPTVNVVSVPRPHTTAAAGTAAAVSRQPTAFGSSPSLCPPTVGATTKTTGDRARTSFFAASASVVPAGGGGDGRRRAISVLFSAVLLVMVPGVSCHRRRAADDLLPEKGDNSGTGRLRRERASERACVSACVRGKERQCPPEEWKA